MCWKFTTRKRRALLTLSWLRMPKRIVTHIAAMLTYVLIFYGDGGIGQWGERRSVQGAASDRSNKAEKSLGSNIVHSGMQSSLKSVPLLSPFVAGLSIMMWTAHSLSGIEHHLTDPRRKSLALLPAARRNSIWSSGRLHFKMLNLGRNLAG